MTVTVFGIASHAKINKQRADLGAYQNRLEAAVRGIDVGAENLQATKEAVPVLPERFFLRLARLTFYPKVV